MEHRIGSQQRQHHQVSSITAIPPASAVTLDAGVTVGTFIIDPDDSLTISNAQSLSVVTGPMNAGQISVSTSRSDTRLRVNSGSHEDLSGGGTLTLSSSGGDADYDQTGGGSA